jgi:hypothetical protein
MTTPKTDIPEKNPEEYLKQLNMPKLCARCGENPGESAWPIHSRYNFSFKMTRTTYKKSRFYVPVCNSCKSQMERDNTLWLRISWVSWIGIILMVLLAIFLYQYALLFLLLSLLGVAGLTIAYIKRTKYWGDSGIASYDGEYFIFYNQTFQNQFGELNPSLVRKP